MLDIESFRRLDRQDARSRVPGLLAHETRGELGREDTSENVKTTTAARFIAFSAIMDEAGKEDAGSAPQKACRAERIIGRGSGGCPGALTRQTD